MAPSDTLFDDHTPTYPESVLLSIYQAYPRKCNRKEALKRIREALDRICAGEIDGDKRSVQEAITFLRGKVDGARVEMGGREAKFIPHMTTWAHQSRYLRSAAAVELPARMSACIRILACYPKMPEARVIAGQVQTFLPALAAIDKALERTEKDMEPWHTYRLAYNADLRLTTQVQLYAKAVGQWPIEDLQFVPSPKKWFDEARYEHNPESWVRQPANGYDQERQQLERVINRRSETGSGSGSVN